MKKWSMSIIIAVSALLVFSIPGVGAVSHSNSHSSAGAVYIMTNNPAGNEVVVYSRSADGTLTWSGNFATNGAGVSGLTGSNQGGLVLSQDGNWLFVVNAGSNGLSVFKVGRNGLTLTDKVSSQGTMPISVTIHGNLVYVLNGGSSTVAGNIAGFHIGHDGELSAIAGSVRPLSGIAAAAQISFNPKGSLLVVTEKSTSLIDIYTVTKDGVATGPTTHSSSGKTPFGFAFDARGHLIVSEAAGGPEGTSAVSSYAVSPSGGLTILSGSVADNQMAACWLVATSNNEFAYTTNAHSGTISSYTIYHNGTIKLLQEVAANTGTGDLDMSLAKNSRFLYVFVNGAHSIEGFRVHSDGSLELLTTTNGIPAGADGLAAN